MRAKRVQNVLMGGFSMGQVLDRHKADLVQLPDEDAFLSEVDLLPELADSDDPCWTGDAAWEPACRLVAAADVVGLRGWKLGVGPIFERAALGGLYGLMQSIRHGPEQAYEDDVPGLAELMAQLTTHHRPGTRQWSVRELGILRQLSSVEVVDEATRDPVPGVRDEARNSLGMLAHVHRDARVAIDHIAQRGGQRTTDPS